jgi:hypothetical protein
VQEGSSLYKVVEKAIPKAAFTRKNNDRSWTYGYNEDYDVVVISKTGRIGEIVDIQGLRVALPEVPQKCLQRHSVSTFLYGLMDCLL